VRSVRKTPPLQPFINAKHDPFTKTGSGQTQEKFEKREMIKRVFFLQALAYSGRHRSSFYCLGRFYSRRWSSCPTLAAVFTFNFSSFNSRTFLLTKREGILQGRSFFETGLGTTMRL
jgi:hypothetical protein